MGERGIARLSVHEIVPRFRSAPPSPNSPRTRSARRRPGRSSWWRASLLELIDKGVAEAGHPQDGALTVAHAVWHFAGVPLGGRPKKRALARSLHDLAHFAREGNPASAGIVGDQTWSVSLHAASATLESAVGLQFVVD